MFQSSVYTPSIETSSELNKDQIRHPPPRFPQVSASYRLFTFPTWVAHVEHGNPVADILSNETLCERKSQAQDRFLEVFQDEYKTRPSQSVDRSIFLHYLFSTNLGPLRCSSGKTIQRKLFMKVVTNPRLDTYADQFILMVLTSTGTLSWCRQWMDRTPSGFFSRRPSDTSFTLDRSHCHTSMNRTSLSQDLNIKKWITRPLLLSTEKLHIKRLYILSNRESKAIEDLINFIVLPQLGRNSLFT